MPAGLFGVPSGPEAAEHKCLGTGGAKSAPSGCARVFVRRAETADRRSQN